MSAVVTVPGQYGVAVAFVAELSISFLLMLVVLYVSNARRLARFTGVFAGCLVAAFITFEDPLSGMSMNPARSLASAVPAGVFTAIWVYFTAPIMGMLLAAQLYLVVKGRAAVHCAKLHHQNRARCIFCEFQASLPYPSPRSGDRGASPSSQGKGRGLGDGTEPVPIE